MSASLTSEIILTQLRGVKYPGYSRDIVSFGLVKDVQIDGNRVTVRIALTTADANIPKLIEETATRRHRIDSRRQRSFCPTRRQRPGQQSACRPRVVPSPKPEDRRHQARHRRRQRQGRRRQIDCRGQSRRRPARRKKSIPGRSLRLRYLWPEHRPDVRHSRTPHGNRGGPHPTDPPLRSQPDEHGFSFGRYRPGHSARAHGHPLHAAISAQRRLGRARLSRPRSASPAPAISS